MTWQPSPETKNLCGVQKIYIYILYIIYIYYIYLLLYPISLHHSAYYFVAYVLLIFAKYCTQDN